MILQPDGQNPWVDASCAPLSETSSNSPVTHHDMTHNTVRSPVWDVQSFMDNGCGNVIYFDTGGVAIKTGEKSGCGNLIC